MFRDVLRSAEFRGSFAAVIFAVLDPLGTGNLGPFRAEIGRWVGSKCASGGRRGRKAAHAPRQEAGLELEPEPEPEPEPRPGPGLEPAATLTATVLRGRAVTVYKVLAGADVTLASYNRDCVAADGDGAPQRQDWKAIYTQFTRHHVLGTVPHRWGREGVSVVRLVAVTFDALDIVVLDGALMHDGALSGATKAAAAKRVLGLPPAAPLMAALGERGQAALVRETAAEWELVMPHALLSRLRYAERAVARFERHARMPTTRRWRPEGATGWQRWRDDLAPECIADLPPPY
eukprot:SAG11_NODE_1842_length_4179_cov_2.865931_2_plen_290_part_00